ncbi:Arginase family [Novymonas esmeraldas]|uniref:Arginase family n=1 Tax=Novymonas esmeraldas TaxID=1808958 RepID=A0AAW0F4J3_9TRYP
MLYNLHGGGAAPPLSAEAAEREGKTLRVTVPSWQGGTLPLYHFGSQLLTALVPPTQGPQVVVTVTPPEQTRLPLTATRGINGLEDNVENVRKTAAVCTQHQADNVVVLGGDCFAELAPFAYLAHRYRDRTFGVLWIDAHPDVMHSKDWANAHTYVLANLAGKGDTVFTNFVESPVPGPRIMIAGMHHPSPVEQEHITDYGMRTCAPEDILSNGAATVLQWIKSEGITHLAIHLDLDVLSERYFRLLYFCDPHARPGAWDGIPKGMLRFSHVAALVRAVAAHTQVVGVGITELLPWDVYNLREFLKELPLVNPAFSSRL